MYSQNEDINLIFTKDKKFMLGDYPLEFKSMGKYKLEKINLDLGKYNISLDDKFNNEKVQLTTSFKIKVFQSCSETASFCYT